MDRKHKKDLDARLLSSVRIYDTAQIKQALAAGADINASGYNGWTSMHYAAIQKADNIECMKLLIRSGADINIKNDDGSTPLDTAVRHMNTAYIQLLIQSGADVNMQNNGGRTPLHYAAINGDIGCIELLITAGADVNIKNRDGETPFGTLKERHQDLYAKYIGRLQYLIFAVQAVNDNDIKSAADTGFEFDI